MRYLQLVYLVLEKKPSNSSHAYIRLYQTRDDLRKYHKREANYIEQSETDKSGWRIQIIVLIYENVNDKRSRS